MTNKVWLVLLAALLFWPLAGQTAPSSARLDSLIDAPPPEQAAPEAKPAVVGRETKPQEKPHELHRLDFRMEGKSCPVCLLSIQNKLKSLNGVQDAAVMLRRPFGVSVIYETGKANSEYLLTMLRAKEPVIKIFEISDKKVDSIPVPLIPPFVPAPAAKPPLNNMPDAVKPTDGGL